VTYDLDTRTEDRVSLVSPQSNVELNGQFARPATAGGDQMTPLRVMIADDFAMIRCFLGVVVESCWDYNVVGMAGDGPQAVAMAETLQPDIVLLDMLMPRTNGTGVLYTAPQCNERMRALIKYFEAPIYS
jgi:PleD family two-component response regulator